MNLQNNSAKTFMNMRNVFCKTDSKVEKTIALSQSETGFILHPTSSQTIRDSEGHAKILDKIIEAIKNKRYSDASKYFTLEGLEIYNK